MGGLLCYSLLESCYLVVPFDVSFISPATILLLSLSLSRTDVASNSIPRTFAHWTGLDWPGLAWPAGMVILQMTNGHFADESRNGLWESLVLPTSSS